MNAIDLIVCLVLAVAVFNGARRGFIVQVCSLAGVAAGIWLGVRYGTMVGGWMQLDESIAAPGGFVTVLLVVVLTVSIAALLVRKAFRIAGFGIADAVLGVVVAVAKYVLVISALCSAFARLNVDHTLVSAPVIETSRSYKPLMNISAKIMPFFGWIGDQIPESDKKTE